MLNSCYCLAKLWPYYCLNCTGAISCTHNTLMAHPFSCLHVIQLLFFFCHSYYKYLSPLHHVAQSLLAVISCLTVICSAFSRCAFVARAVLCYVADLCILVTRLWRIGLATMHETIKYYLFTVLCI